MLPGPCSKHLGNRTLLELNQLIRDKKVISHVFLRIFRCSILNLDGYPYSQNKLTKQEVHITLDKARLILDEGYLNLDAHI